jgi:ornithine cyclodeaminase/alanine dehydrogenase-like protein (mu-crystallin family)
MTLFLNEAEVSQVATMEMALEAVDEAFHGLGRGEAQVRPRQRIQLSSGSLHTLVGGLPSSRALGLKTYTVYGAPRFLVVLFDSENGELLSIMEADRLGQLRTGAASGVATRYLARPDAAVVGLFGSGWQARTQIEAVCAVRRIKQIRVYSRNRERREAFCREMGRQLGVELVPIESGEAAVKGADVLITITNAREPVLLGEWLAPGQHINAAGSSRAREPELDVEAVRRADVVAADSVEQAKIEAGDLIGAVAAGALTWERVLELGDVVVGKHPGRASAEQITLFESLGLGVEDLALAARVYRLAKARGLGREIEIFGPAGQAPRP